MTQPAALVGHQLRYDMMAFFRNSQARFFTLALPVAFLLIFATVFSDKTVPVPGGLIHTSVYYVPGIIALGIIQAAVSNLALSVITQRESGILKRRRATPVSAGVLITGRALTAVIVALIFLASTLLPHWLLNVASVFPVRPFQQALLAAYNPYSSGSGFARLDLLVVAAWGLAGLLIAVRLFRWTPQSR
jgi:ABC-type multidrug transport system permease subunit